MTRLGKANLAYAANRLSSRRHDFSEHSLSWSGLSVRPDGHRGVVRYALRFRLDLTASGNIIWYVRERWLDLSQFLMSPRFLLTIQNFDPIGSCVVS